MGFPTYQSALSDFTQARQHAALQEVLARLRGKSNELLSYEEVARQLKLSTRTDRGLQDIPLKAIVGSVGRYRDFTRTFLPKRAEDQQRWARVKMAFSGSGAGFPPIEVYKVGEVYFVLDGNHRVSIALREGLTFIDAYVIEVKTDVPLTPDIQPDDLIIKAEYAEFLQETGLTRLRPHVDLSVTAPGQYQILKEQIQVHRYWLEQSRQQPVTEQAAVVDWYDEVYLPAVTAIRERGLLRSFPHRTETDLYLWVSEYRQALEQELGWAIRSEAAVADLAVKESAQVKNEEATPGSWRKARIIDRYSDRLLKDILVPLTGTPESWQALAQAIDIAQREQAQLQGLHIVATDTLRNNPAVLVIQQQFNQLCAAAGVAGNLAIETGDVTRKICDRALLTDLVVLNVAHPPAAGLSSLGSGLRTIIWRSARPILAVRGEPSRLERALLLYDGSPKSKEALFLATYLAECWQTALTVLTVTDGARVLPATQDYARSYLELHEIQAELLLEQGPIDIALGIAQERQIDLVVIGGYGVSALEEIMIGSVVNFLLRDWHCPLLICR
jgi:nucleotide-binding universal stress UspA family protein